jgi:hypothetical protein
MRFLTIVLCFTQSSIAADLVPIAGDPPIVIDGPKQIEARRYEFFVVKGVASESLTKMATSVTPDLDATLRVFKTLDDTPVLAFRASAPGTYILTVSVNGWRIAFDAGVEQAISVIANDEAEYLLSLQDRFEVTYPVSEGRCAVTVIGDAPAPDPNPEPDPNPQPNPEPNPTQWQCMIFYESDNLDNMQPEQLELISGRVFRRELQQRGHVFVGAVDVDSFCDGVTCSVPPDITPWWAAAESLTPPVLAIAPLDGGDIKAMPLPRDARSFYTALENRR